MPSSASSKRKATPVPELPPVAAPVHAASPWRVGCLIALFVLAFIVRIANIGQPPFDFHPTRQYHSALIAQGYYTLGSAISSADDKTRAQHNIAGQGILEPPILEHVAAWLFGVFGNDSLAIPRTLSILFWLLGGVLLYMLGVRLFTPDSAVFITAAYLFLPFGVVASRSFQPDPLMVLLIIASLLALRRYDDEPAPSRLWWAAGLSAAAIFVKPVAAFFTLVPFFVVTLARYARQPGGWPRAFRVWQHWAYLGIALLPGVLYYFHGLLFLKSLQGQAEGTFIASLLSSSMYWLGWLNMVGQVSGLAVLTSLGITGFLIGLVLILGGIIGVVLARQPARAMLIGLWIGYLFFCLVFNYRVYTHNYYHLPFLPILALSLAPICMLLERVGRPVRLAGWALLGVAVCVVGAMTRKTLDSPLAVQKVADYIEIGDKLNHPDRTIFLSEAYGEMLIYYGKISGQNWPSQSDMGLDMQMGRPVPPPDVRLQQMLAAPTPPQYFIITDFPEIQRQADLLKLLNDHFNVASTEHYLVYDLQHPH